MDTDPGISGARQRRLGIARRQRQIERPPPTEAEGVRWCWGHCCAASHSAAVAIFVATSTRASSSYRNVTLASFPDVRSIRYARTVGAVPRRGLLDGHEAESVAEADPPRTEHVVPGHCVCAHCVSSLGPLTEGDSACEGPRPERETAGSTRVLGFSPHHPWVVGSSPTRPTRARLTCGNAEFVVEAEDRCSSSSVRCFRSRADV